jgi:hypothetical protein
MSGFTSDWLALREPADRSARSSTLALAVGDAMRQETVGVLDLGAGTGANARYLAKLLPAEQRWLMIDDDPALLALVPGCMRTWATAEGYQIGSAHQELTVRGTGLTCAIRTRRADLAELRDAALFEGYALITASALLDLVSERWISALANLCHLKGAAVLLSLTYDGRIHCDPVEPEDSTIRELVNLHQHSDKGFGSALGPQAAFCAERCFGALGYQVRRESSDWRLPAEARELQRRLIEGWAEAAVAVAPGEADRVARWLARRLEHVQAGRSRIVVGHQDLAAWLDQEETAR